MVESTERKVVTVTGISGFLGTNTGAELLKVADQNNWKIRGTVRSTTNEAKMKPLRSAWGDRFDEIELVEADLTDAESLKTAIAGSTYVIHTASPFFLGEPRDPMELIGPAVEGTKNLFRACQAAGVRRVTMTSSMASITGLKPENRPDVFDETIWSDPDQQDGAYEKSKTLAEKAAWEFVDAMPEDEKIELTTCCPGFIIGPVHVGPGFSSGKAINMFMTNSFPGGAVPQIQFGMVDARDIALAHIRCLERDEVQGQRFMLTAGSLWMREIGEILKEHYEPQGFNVPTKEAKYCLVKLFSMFNAQAATIAKYWGRALVTNNQRTKDMLSLEFRDTP